MILKRKFKDALAPPPLRLAHPWLTAESRNIFNGFERVPVKEKIPPLNSI